MQHNIKKLRNNIEKSSARGKRYLTKDGKQILWSHWEEAYLWDQNSNSLPIHERLKEDHFHLTPSSRMRNALAEDVLDKRMLFLMQVRKVNVLSRYFYDINFALQYTLASI